MEHSLIANSGIQLYTQEVKLDLNARSKTLFREWFDEEEVQTNVEFVYQLRESEKGVLVISGAEIAIKPMSINELGPFKTFEHAFDASACAL